MWPNARISVMGGEQAADRARHEEISSSATAEQARREWSKDEEEAFKQPIREQYEHQGHPTYASARLWDDGVIDPLQTRRALALGLSAA